jgi:hypothetical protein
MGVLRTDAAISIAFRRRWCIVSVAIGMQLACGRTALEEPSGPGAIAGSDSGVLSESGPGSPPGVPRPIAPLSTSRVTTRRPTLRWALPSGLAAVTVDLCRDRACTRPVAPPTLVTGTSFTPSTDLPVGVVYWRLHPSTNMLVAGPTWQFDVGARSAPVDTSFGTTLDVNGDGYADVVVGARGVAAYRGRAYVYVGGAGGLAAVPAVTLSGPDQPNTTFGASVASAGDVNGDGYGDLIVGAAGAGGGGSAYVYLGSATGLVSVPASTVTGPDGASGLFGSAVASAGDVNGDGYADVLVGASGVADYTGRAYVYFGGAAGLATAPAVTLGGPDGPGAMFGVSVAGAGDVNGDGYGDLVVGADEVSSYTGRVHVYLGGAGLMSGNPAETLTPPGASTGFGMAVAGAGDVNGDGYADVVVGAPDFENLAGIAYVYFGGPAGLASVPAATLPAVPFAPDKSAYVGASVASAGDVNGDGYADLVIGAPTDAQSGGNALLYAGGPSGPAPGGSNWWHSPDGPQAAFGQSVSSAGDVNGDGYADVIVGAWQVLDQSGRAYVFPGSSAGAAQAPAIVLTGPDGAMGDFGLVVSGASP